MRSEILLVCGRFQIDNTISIGSGAFSRVHPATDLETQQEVAVKIMLTRHGTKQVQMESKILKQLQGQSREYIDFPRVIWHGIHQGLETEVMQRLGRSLLDLFWECGRKFSLPTVLQLADQLIPALQELHSIGYVHMDLKPDNLVMGRGVDEDKVFIIDFGLAQMIMPHGKHVKMKKDLKFKGNAYWASTHLLSGVSGSRRDDMEALMYVLLYLLKGELPWQQVRDRRNRLQHILEVKSTTSLSSLCHSLPCSFLRVFEYIRSLTFSEEPDYAWIRETFRETAENLGVQFDGKFEWKESPKEIGFDQRIEDWGFMDSPEDEHYSQDDTSEMLRHPAIHTRVRSGSISLCQQSPNLSTRTVRATPRTLMAALNRQDTGSRSPGSLLFVRQSSLKTSSSVSPHSNNSRVDGMDEINIDESQGKTFTIVSSLAAEEHKNADLAARRKSIKIAVLPAQDDTPEAPWQEKEKEDTPKTEKVPQLTQFVREKLADSKK